MKPLQPNGLWEEGWRVAPPSLCSGGCEGWTGLVAPTGGVCCFACWARGYRPTGEGETAPRAGGQAGAVPAAESAAEGRAQEREREAAPPPDRTAESAPAPQEGAAWTSKGGAALPPLDDDGTDDDW